MVPLARLAQGRNSATASSREPISQHSPSVSQSSIQSSINAWADWKLMRIQQSWEQFRGLFQTSTQQESCWRCAGVHGINRFGWQFSAGLGGFRRRNVTVTDVDMIRDGIHDMRVPTTWRICTISSLWIVSRSILPVTVSSQTALSLLQKKMPRERRLVTVMPQRRALARYRIAPWIVEGIVTSYEDVPTDSGQAFNVDNNGTAIRAHHSRGRVLISIARRCGSVLVARSEGEGCRNVRPFSASNPHLSVRSVSSLSSVVVART